MKEMRMLRDARADSWLYNSVSYYFNKRDLKTTNICDITHLSHLIQ